MRGHLNSYVDIARYKNLDWKYESEYRYIVDEGDKLYDWVDLGDGVFTRLSAIIFGCLSDVSIANAITKITGSFDYKIDIRRAALSDCGTKVKV